MIPNNDKSYQSIKTYHPNILLVCIRIDDPLPAMFRLVPPFSFHPICACFWFIIPASPTLVKISSSFLPPSPSLHICSCCLPPECSADPCHPDPASPLDCWCPTRCRCGTTCMSAFASNTECLFRRRSHLNLPPSSKSLAPTQYLPVAFALRSTRTSLRRSRRLSTSARWPLRLRHSYWA